MFIKNLGTWCETNDVAVIFLTQRTAHSPFKKTVAYKMSSQLLNDFVDRGWLVHYETELSSSLQRFRTEWFSVKLNSCYSCEGKILSQSTNPGNATWKLIACQWNDSNLGKFKTRSCSQIKKSFKCWTPFSVLVVCLYGFNLKMNFFIYLILLSILWECLFSMPRLLFPYMDSYPVILANRGHTKLVSNLIS